MISLKRVHVGFALGLALLLLAVSPAAAQPYVYTFDNGWSGAGMPPLPATGTWGVNANWNNNLQPGTANNVLPYAYFQEMALLGGTLNNGTVLFAPVTVNVTTLQDTLGTSASSPVATRRAVGGVTVANGSTLNITGTGRLVVLTTFGPNGATTGVPTPGTGDAIIETASAINVQSAGQFNVTENLAINNGTFTVLPGGVATAKHVNSLADGNLVLSGNASLTSSGSSSIAGRTTITGPSVVFSTHDIQMTDTAVFNPVITGANHSIINVPGSVLMNGTLRPQFQGVTPVLGNTWVIWDSGVTEGAFDFSDDSLTDLPTGHRYTVTTTTVGSVNGTRGLLTVENFLTAEVNRANGQVTLRNTATTGGVTIQAYQIASAADVLNPANFTSSLDDDNFDGGEWLESNPTAGSVAELNQLSDSLIATSSSNLLGAIYDPVPTLAQFGDPVPEDLVFTYRRSDGRFVTGAVDYINDGIDNTLELQVDPTDGKARIINDSTFDGVRFDSYRILSASGSLKTTWNSLDDQNVGGANTWVESAPTVNTLTELNTLPQSDPQSSIEVDAGQVAAVMTGLFTVGGMQDLVFEFRAASPEIGPAIGDYNENGVVDVGDYTYWRNRLGQAVAMPNEDPNTTPGSVTPEDYDVWKANFGNTQSGGGLGSFEVLTGAVRYEAFSLGSGAGELSLSPVPEPSCFVLAALLTCGLLVGTRCRGNFLTS